MTTNEILYKVWEIYINIGLDLLEILKLLSWMFQDKFEVK